VSPQLVVILAAHGAGNGSPANEGVEALARQVAAARPDLRVHCAFRLGTPTLSDVCAAVTAPDQHDAIVVVPIMTSDGYFMSHWLRPIVAEAQQHTHRIRVAAPIGTDVSLQRAIARDALEHAPHEDSATILVVGHGTQRHAMSGGTTLAIVDAIRCAEPSAAVAACFLDDEPRLERAALQNPERALLVVPWLIGGGGHARHDVIARLGGRPATIRPALLDSPHLIGAILRATDHNAPERVFRIGTRTSRLARVQAEYARAALAEVGASTAIVPFTPCGDRDLATRLDGFPTDGPFTDEIEAALIEGTIDFAVHSLKDLPLAPSRDAAIGAVLRRGSAQEALVTRDGCTLRDLPAGSRVGTCSERRRVQLLALRPDLVVVPVRGAVDDRVRQLDAGHFDALILAAVGLERLGMASRISERFSFEQFVPEAGQGAIALTVRRDDARAIELCRRIDHAATRAAVDAEREFARCMKEAAQGLVAAIATVGDEVTLHTRSIARDGTWIDVVRRGATSEDAATRALRATLAKRPAEVLA